MAWDRIPRPSRSRDRASARSKALLSEKTGTPEKTLPEDFQQARKDFASYLLYTRGLSKGTCYGYNSDVCMWGRWLVEHDHDWKSATHHHVEQFIAWHVRDREVKPHVIARRLSALGQFYKWGRRQELVDGDPVYLVDKPKKPGRMPVWLTREEQQKLQAAARDVEDLPENIFGRTQDRIIEVRKRYDFLFSLILNSGLRISEALGVRVRDIELIDSVAASVRVIGKGDKERRVPLPSAFGQVFGFWLNGRKPDEFVFSKEDGNPPTPHAVRAYLKRLIEKSGIDKKVTPHKLRHTYATRLLEKDVQLVDIQTLLGHVNMSTTQIYTHVSQDRLTGLVSDL